MNIFFEYISKLRLVLFLSITLGVLAFGDLPLNAQVTPGLIVKPATGAGKLVLDPDGDGYVSAKTNGVQLGFTIPPNNDVLQSEIPYVPVIKPDPRGDILRGPSGGFSDIVGVDAAGNNAIMTYTDGVNVFYRFRLDNLSPNTTTYSILLDTDGKFGFTGDNADPNAVSGNPGFEIEISLTTNFHVRVYNVDGTTNGTLVYSAPYDTNCQKSVALSTSSNNPDYFYDFFVPLSALTGITFSPPTFPANITADTPLRYVAVTTMNTQPAIGNNALSDIGGATGSGSVDNIFESLIEEQTPTPPGEEVLERSACPTINSITASNTSISGSSTELSGTTIKVSVYQSNGTTLIGSGTTTTSGSSWFINVSALSPSVTLAAGQIVRATATAPEKGESYDNCSQKTVTETACYTPPPISLSGNNSGRFTVVFSLQTAGTKTIRVYNADGTVWGSATSTSTAATTYLDVQNGIPMTTNGKIPDGTYYASVTFNGCESARIVMCWGNSTTAAPTINTPLVAGATTVSGTGIVGGNIRVFADGVLIGSVNNLATTNWSVTVPALSQCQVITATQSKVSAHRFNNSGGNGSCESAPTAPVTLTRQAFKPAILSPSCVSAPFALSGSSAEADGTTITLYTPNSSGSVVGTTTVTNGAWTVTGLNLSSGTVVVAKVTAGNCLTPSADSDPITISTKTNIASYTISINETREEQTSVSGTITGGSYPVTLTLFIDEVEIGEPIVVNGAGNWTVSDLIPNNLYINGELRIRAASAGGCDSDLSSYYTVVLCNPPAVPNYTGGDFNYCIGGTGEITLLNSQDGVIYQVVNSSGVSQGPSVLGTGDAITLFTNPISSNLTNVFVRAFKVLNPSCAVTSSQVINFNIQLAAPTVTFTTTSLSVLSGGSSVNLAYSAKSTTPSADKYTIEYSFAAKQQGFVDVTTPTTIPSSPIVLAVPTAPAPPPGTYSGTIVIYSDGGGACESRYGFTISVYAANSAPVINVNPAGTTICNNTTTSLTVTAVGAGTLTYQWQSSDSFLGTYTNVVGGSGATTANYTTPTLSAQKFYRVVVSNANGSTISSIAVVDVVSAPAAAGAISGITDVKAGQSYVSYSIPVVDDATSYVWNYSGTGVTINGSSNNIFISFSSQATSGTLSVYAANACGSGSASSLNITIRFNACVTSNKNIGKDFIK